jgi:ATP-dependent Lhr-like helicase
LRGDRGGQTLCLIERLSRLAGVTPRRIGLSATIGDPEATGELLSLNTGRKTIMPKVDAKGSKWRLSMEHFYVKDVQAAEGKNIQNALPVLEEKTAEAPKSADPGIGYIYEHTRGKKCLVFVNSREECETVTTTLR